jgi:hypothetical protein
MARRVEAPGVTVPEASQDLQTGDAGSADAPSVFHYTTSAPPGIPQSRFPRLVSWLRCRACQRAQVDGCSPWRCGTWRMRQHRPVCCAWRVTRRCGG